MELVEGPTLADRIASGPVSLSEALSIARQVAEALAAAHEQGIIHRDLKPANIKVRPDGIVKVLDFGLAKVSGPPSTLTASAMDSPTLSRHMTQAGLILGTAAYMSPEQARGKPVDTRTDIWAFGCVLFEMLAGQPAFAGETTSDTIARILEREPEWQTVDTIATPRVRVLLRRCLQKDQQQRLRDIVDARVEIAEAHASRPGRGRLAQLRWLAAAVMLGLGLAAGARWFAQRSIPPQPHDPVTVLIADLQNNTGDPAFTRALEPMLKFALEGASFISAYDRSGITRNLGVRPPETLDERAALEMALKQGLSAVLSGSLDLQGSRYELSVTATHAVTGKVMATARAIAASKDQVLTMVSELAAAVRKAFGDSTSEEAQRFATQTFSATSLEVVRAYAAAAEDLSKNRTENALENFARAVALDPNFGLGYAGMASALRNLDKQRDAEKYAKEAVRHLDSMTERERYRTRGLFYMVTGDDLACVKEYGELITRYAADAAARNNRALCMTHLRRMPEALEEMRQAVKILPKRALYRVNLALYEAYSGDFQAAEREAGAMETPGLFGGLAMAFAQQLQGQLAQAAETYQGLAKLDEQGASYAASGLADLALFEGRFSAAALILSQGAAADLASNDADRAASKFAALANTQILRRQSAAAIAAADQALAHSHAVKIRFLAARAYLAADAEDRAQTISDALAAELQAEPQAYAKVMEGERLLKRGDARGAIKALTDGTALLDTWIGRFNLGRAC